MEASRPEHEIRDEPAATAAGGGVGIILGGLRQLIDVEVVLRRRLQSAALFFFWACLGGLCALWKLIELEVAPRLQAAVVFLFRGCSGGIVTLRHLIEPEDRRLQAAAFFLTCGGSTVLYGTALNRSANPEHVLVGFFLFTLGAAISILTLTGAGAATAAAQMERFLVGFF